MADSRQRYLREPDDESIIIERRQVCALLVGFGNGSRREQLAHARAYELADKALELALSDAETVRRHDGDRRAMPWFQHGSLYYFELVLSHVTGTPLS